MTNPMTPAAIRHDVEDSGYLYKAREVYGSLALALSGRLQLNEGTSIQQLVIEALNTHEEAGEALQRIAERHK